MSNRKGAFTLIELLVVIAIIAILAAILFPVFAQAKAAAKTTVALSNTKQIGTSQQMYISDNDDVYPIRRFCLLTSPKYTKYSWKQAMHPYAKSTQIYTDPVNNGSRYLDDTSMDSILAADGLTLTADSKLPQFARGYAMNNIAFYLNGRWDAWECDPTASQNTINGSSVDEPSSVAALWETKMQWVDVGSYINWANGANDYNDDDGVHRFSGWNWGGGKWDEKAMSLVYMDSHAKRTAHSAICGMTGVTPFGWKKSDLSNHAPGGDMSWLYTYCDTMPASVK